MAERSVVKNYLYSSLTTVLNVAVPLVTYPYAARVLGPANMGRLGVAGSLANYFIVAAGLGLSVYGVRAVAKARHDRAALGKVLAELYALSLAAASLAAAAFALVVALVPRYRADAGLLAVYGATILAAGAGLEWFFQGMEEFRYIGLRNLGVQALFVAALFVFVRVPGDAVAYAGLYAATMLVSVAVNLRAALRLAKPELGGLKPLRHLPGMAALAAVSFAVTGYTNMDLLFLGLLAPREQAGLYVIALRIARMVVTVSATLSAVLLPRLSALAESDHGEYRRVLKRSFGAMALFALPAAAGLSAVAPDLVALFAGAEFGAARASLRVTAWLVPVVGLSNFLQMQVLIPTGRERRMLLSFGLGAAVGGAACALLIPGLGHVGAAVGMLAAEAAVAVAHLALAGRGALAGIAVAKDGLRYLSGSAACWAAASGVSALMAPGAARLAAASAAGAATYAAWLLISGDELAREALGRVLAAVKRPKENT